ncbi:MAG: xanthine dehydrogenase family protein subunit M [Desulfobacterales bacterium]|nr:MAG: xanthine dehydrogenase family protein subunit M [Desulfobacterales bacterium]
MKAFKHITANSVEEAIALIRTHNGKACLIAGGTDLLGVLKDEILPDYPAAVINIKTIPELDHIKKNNDGLKIGPLTKLADVVAHPLIKKRFSCLSQAAAAVATPEIRNMATLGGNLCQDTRCWYYRYPQHVGGRIMCHRKGKGPCQAVKGDNRYHAIMGAKVCFAVCPSDTAIALSALDAELEITGSQGVRNVSLNEFFTTLGNILKPDELLTNIQIPYPPKGAKQAFLKFTLRKPVDFAIASVASVITMQDGICKAARIVLGAVAPTPVRATDAEASIIGKAADGVVIEEAAEAAMAGAKPMRMNAYKVEITKTLIKRALLSIFQ